MAHKVTLQRSPDVVNQLSQRIAYEGAVLIDGRRIECRLVEVVVDPDTQETIVRLEIVAEPEIVNGS